MDEAGPAATERRIEVRNATAAVKGAAQWAVIMAGIMIGAVVLLNLFSPKDPTGSIATIVGIGTPVILALLGKGIYGMAVSIDGRLSQLLKVEGDKKKLEGKIEGLKENPDINFG